MSTYPAPARLQQSKPRKVYYLRMGKKLFYIYEMYIRDEVYIDKAPAESAFVESVKPIVGNGGYKLRTFHPLGVGLSEVSKTLELAEREAIRRVRWNK